MLCVIAEDGTDGGEEGAFAVASGSIEDEESFFACARGKAIADCTLDILAEEGIALGDLCEEGVPDG